MAARKAQFNSEEIVETAFQMVRKNGWKGLSVPAVAKTINCSTMPIYSHFKNVRELEDAVYIKALSYLTEYMEKERTGDQWLDHAIGYIHFAAEENQLFRCLFDGRNPELQTKSLRIWAKGLGDQLIDYPLFEGLSEEQIHIIRSSRFMLIHGYASGMNNGWFTLKSDEELEQYLEMTSKALYDGLRMKFEAEK
ncbi:MAG: TetR/AcrR family transcriptional regulator [Desulfuromonadales bacterium]|nr:TetR/AcrR family transcriptional regulator [Desulfuromonadales bacterium]